MAGGAQSASTRHATFLLQKVFRLAANLQALEGKAIALAGEDAHFGKPVAIGGQWCFKCVCHIVTGHIQRKTTCCNAWARAFQSDGF